MAEELGMMFSVAQVSEAKSPPAARMNLIVGPQRTYKSREAAARCAIKLECQLCIDNSEKRCNMNARDPNSR